MFSQGYTSSPFRQNPGLFNSQPQGGTTSNQHQQPPNQQPQQTQPLQFSASQQTNVPSSSSSGYSNTASLSYYPSSTQAPQFGGAGPGWTGSGSSNNNYGSPGGSGLHNQFSGGMGGGFHSAQSQFGYGGGMMSNANTAMGHSAVGTPGGGGAGDKAKKNYLPGYLSGGGPMGQTEASSSPQDRSTYEGDTSRAWESPVRRTSMSSGSPINRNQTLFGDSASLDRDGTPARSSPKTTPYKRDLGPRSGRSGLASVSGHQETEDDAPPIESLGEMGDGDTSMDQSYSYSAHPSANLDTVGSTPLQAASSTTASNTHASTPSFKTASKGYAVHVFGFPSASLPLVLSHFSQIGEVLSSMPSVEGGNWVTVVYKEAWSAVRAGRRNGEVLGGVLMVGVKVLDDEDVLRRATTNVGSGVPSESLAGMTSSSSNVATQSQPMAQKTPSNPSRVGTPVKVFGASSAFKPNAPTPRKGLFSLGMAAGGGSTPGAAGANSAKVGTANGTSNDPHAGLFAEKSRLAVMKMEEQRPGPGVGSTGQGVLSKVSDMVFGW